MDRLTPGQIRSLAALVSSLRDDWTRPGIEAALQKARDVAAAADVAVAAIRASQVPTNTTPAVIPLDGPHWRTSETHTYFGPVPRHLRCSICGRPKADCVRVWSTEHDFQPDTRPDHGIDVPRTVQALRDECAAATTKENR